MRLTEIAVTLALAGEEAIGWSQERDTAVVRNTAAVPLILDGPVRPPTRSILVMDDATVDAETTKSAKKKKKKARRK